MTAKAGRQTLDAMIRRMLDQEPEFCPNTMQIDRYQRMGISDETLQLLRDRHADLWLAASEKRPEGGDA